MRLIVTISSVLLFSHFVWAEICLLEPMLTQHHKICKTSYDCKMESIKKVPFIQNTKGKSDEVRKNEQGNCDPIYKYRSFSGACNNLNYPDWGKANTSYIRFLWPRYATQNGSIAKTVSGKDLPLARYISSKVFPDEDEPSDKYTLVAMQWGQLVTHDTSFSIPAQLNCCESGEENTEDTCYAIEIPANDPFYSKYNTKCIPLQRTLPVYEKFGCKTIRNQYSSTSHYIDMSFMYGLSVAGAATMREYHGGTLQMSFTDDGRQFPPKVDGPNSVCSRFGADGVCFRNQDARMNQHTQLTCLITALLREHNRIAGELSDLNPHWDDETIYQTARSIFIAVFQHISFAEWLPVYFSDDILEKYDLKPLSEGYTKYRADVNAATINSFAAGANRAGHSNIQGQLLMMNNARQFIKQINISDWMWNPGIVLKDSTFDELLIGLATQPQQKSDKYFTHQMTEKMFHGAKPDGQDLESIDIQRGRDHGIPSYNDMRELCKLPRASTFEDLIPDMGAQNAQLLSEIYEFVDDVDYLPGGMLEYKLPGSQYGPAFTCIIIEQFIRKKIGDRFWYEVGDQNHSFTAEQLKEIRKCSLSRILCDNGDNITSIQPHSFKQISEGNTLVSCDSIHKLNLSLWKDK